MPDSPKAHICPLCGANTVNGKFVIDTQVVGKDELHVAITDGPFTVLGETPATARSTTDYIPGRCF